VAFDGTETGWRYAVEIPTVRKTRQALGRVIRSPRRSASGRYSIGATLARRSRISVSTQRQRHLPHEEREELIDIGPEKLKFAMRNFYGDHEAYDGEPPAPLTCLESRCTASLARFDRHVGRAARDDHEVGPIAFDRHVSDSESERVSIGPFSA